MRQVDVTQQPPIDVDRRFLGFKQPQFRPTDLARRLRRPCRRPTQRHVALQLPSNQQTERADVVLAHSPHLRESLFGYHQLSPQRIGRTSEHHPMCSSRIRPGDPYPQVFSHQLGHARLLIEHENPEKERVYTHLQRMHLHIDPATLCCRVSMRQTHVVAHCQESREWLHRLGIDPILIFGYLRRLESGQCERDMRRRRLDRGLSRQRKLRQPPFGGMTRRCIPVLRRDSVSFRRRMVLRCPRLTAVERKSWPAILGRELHRREECSHRHGAGSSLRDRDISYPCHGFNRLRMVSLISVRRRQMSSVYSASLISHTFWKTGVIKNVPRHNVRTDMNKSMV